MANEKGCKMCGVTLNLNEEKKQKMCVSCDANLSKEKAAKALVEHHETILDALYDYQRWWDDGSKDNRERRKTIQKAIVDVQEAL